MPKYLALSLTLAVGLMAAAEAPKDDEGKKDLKGLQGPWIAVAVESGGMPSPLPGPGVAFKGDKVMFAAGISATLKLDAGKKPKEMHLTMLGGPSKGDTMRAIYRLEGEKLILCIPRVRGSKRATEFKTKEGDGLELWVLERAKAKKAP